MRQVRACKRRHPLEIIVMTLQTQHYLISASYESRRSLFLREHCTRPKQALGLSAPRQMRRLQTAAPACLPPAMPLNACPVHHSTR